MNLEDIEKTVIKERLMTTYKSLGMFREMKLLEGINWNFAIMSHKVFYIF